MLSRGKEKVAGDWLMVSFEDCSSKRIALLYKGVAERSSVSWHSEECPTRLGWSPFRVTGSSEAKEGEIYTGKGVI